MVATCLTESLKLLRAGKISSVDLVKAALSRAISRDGCNSGVRRVSPELALSLASDCDLRYLEGKARTLEGLPILVSDLIDTNQIETSYGSSIFEGHMPNVNAPVVQSLNEMGAVIIGKSCVQEFGWDFVECRGDKEETVNPCDPSRVTGGAEGGAGVAIAHAIVHAALVADTGGSAQITAALCGVVGFKPSRVGRLQNGMFSFVASLDQVALMGKTVDDVVTLSSGLNLSRPPRYNHCPNVAALHSVNSIPLQREVSDAFNKALTALKEIAALNNFDNCRVLQGCYSILDCIVNVEAGLEHLKSHDNLDIDRLYSKRIIEKLGKSENYSIGSYARSVRAKEYISKTLDAILEGLDFLILPTLPCVAPRVGQRSFIGGWSGSLEEAFLAYTSPFSLANLPAITIPIPRTGGDLPVGLQIIGRRGKDVELLSFARDVEEILSSAK